MLTKVYWILCQIHAPLNRGGFSHKETRFKKSSKFLEHFLPLSLLKKFKILPVHPAGVLHACSVDCVLHENFCSNQT